LVPGGLKALVLMMGPACLMVRALMMVPACLMATAWLKACLKA
jgi:hypothetical protein